MAPSVTVDDDLKLLYTCIQLSGVKPPMKDVGKYMDLKPNAAAWRFQALMKRLEKQFGPVGDAAVTSSAEHIKPMNTNKRKRTKQNTPDEQIPTKKAKIDGDERIVKEAEVHELEEI